MRRHKMIGRLMALLVILVLAGTACEGIPGLGSPGTPQRSSPPASSLLPVLPGYATLEAQSIQDFITGLGEAGTALLGQFQATAVIALVDRVADCYQEIGAVAARGYSKEALPIVAGVVAVANRDLLLDPQTFLACVGLAQQPSALGEGQGGGGLQPCAHAYSTQVDSSTFDILYAGTDIEICQAFCGALPGCTAH